MWGFQSVNLCYLIVLNKWLWVTAVLKYTKHVSIQGGTAPLLQDGLWESLFSFLHDSKEDAGRQKHVYILGCVHKGVYINVLMMENICHVQLSLCHTKKILHRIEPFSFQWFKFIPCWQTVFHFFGFRTIVLSLKNFQRMTNLVSLVFLPILLAHHSVWSALRYFEMYLMKKNVET